MSMIETISDVNNTFLSRRELVCNFTGLGGKLKKLDAVDMISKEFKLDGKTVIPINMTTHVGKPLMTGTFYVYEDDVLAKKQVNPTIFARLEKAHKKLEEATAAEAEAKEKPAEESKDVPAETKKDVPAETKKDVKEKPAETKKDVPAETKKDVPAETKKDVPAETKKDVKEKPAEETK